MEQLFGNVYKVTRPPFPFLSHCRSVGPFPFLFHLVISHSSLEITTKTPHCHFLILIENEKRGRAREMLAANRTRRVGVEQRL